MEIDAKEEERAHTPQEVTEIMRGILETLGGLVTKEDAKSFATKEDLSKVIAEAKNELKDHTTRECAKVRGDLVAIAHRQDEKTNEFVRTAQKSGTISKNDGIRLLEINPFLQPVD